MTQLARLCRRREFTVTQGFRRREQPVEHVPQVSDRWRRANGAQITLSIVHRTRQGVQVIAEPVEFVAGDHQLVLTQLEFT